MRDYEIAIVGGGLAGATAAAMLGKAGHSVALIDPHEVYPPEFRCEKLDASQVALLRKTGLADAVLRAATPDGEVWIARYGHLIAKKPSARFGIIYDTLVTAIRAQIPQSVQSIRTKVSGISCSADRQRLVLLNGEEVEARLVVMANGLHPGLGQSLGIEHRIVSRCHTIAIGFDMRPAGRPSFDFPALTYFPERAADGAAYISLFPVGSTMRVNMFVYWGMRDDRLRGLREAPQETLFKLWPGLERLTGHFVVDEAVKIRPIDLYVSEGYRQAGVVLVGDAFATACPAVGVGANKVLTDVERLCNEHIPRWLATPGMGKEKIASFYADPAKRACDANSAARAYSLRSLSTEEGLSWGARRWGRFAFQLGISALRRAADRRATGLPGRKAAYAEAPGEVHGPRARGTTAP